MVGSSGRKIKVIHDRQLSVHHQVNINIESLAVKAIFMMENFVPLYVSKPSPSTKKKVRNQELRKKTESKVSSVQYYESWSDA